jgi:2-polyprenyl-3-methyl-5-hydroxy-6-metoxy-1,4-benzoquinol methylase
LRAEVVLSVKLITIATFTEMNILVILTLPVCHYFDHPGKDAVFQSLFGYFDKINGSPDSYQKVLEIGCGTGVIARALHHCGYSGHITAVDQSRPFVEAGSAKALEEGSD